MNLFLYQTIFSLHIKYNNHPINSEEEYNEFLNHIQSDPRFSNYLRIRDKISSILTMEGPLISPHRVVFGAHFAAFNFNKIGIDTKIRPILYWLTESTALRFNGSDTHCIPNTDLALPYLYQSRHKVDPYQVVPILERASIDDIKNPLNEF